MNDLISRKAAMDAFMERPYDYYHTGYIVGELNCISSVPAVPLDKLCALLAKNADCPPEHSPVQDHCKEDCAECWKSVLQEWMEKQDAE